MKKKIISDAVTNISSEYIEKAADYTVARKKSKSLWVKLGTMAACFAVVVALGVGVFQSGLFGNRTDIATLNNGDKITFEQTDTLGGSLSLALDVTTKPLTEDEAVALFADLPVTANAIFKNSDMDAGASQELIGFEGQIGNVKAVISTSDVQLLDTVIVGAEETSEINGVSVVAGYFITEPNSKGEQNVIYYATFELGSCKIYLENAGTKGNSETTKNQLAEVIQKLIENGELDLTSLDNEADARLDGNPNGYDRLPNNQTADEGVSEQDSAAN